MSYFFQMIMDVAQIISHFSIQLFVFSFFQVLEYRQNWLYHRLKKNNVPSCNRNFFKCNFGFLDFKFPIDLLNHHNHLIYYRKTVIYERVNYFICKVGASLTHKVISVPKGFLTPDKNIINRRKNSFMKNNNVFFSDK